MKNELRNLQISTGQSYNEVKCNKNKERTQVGGPGEEHCFSQGPHPVGTVGMGLGTFFLQNFPGHCQMFSNNPGLLPLCIGGQQHY